MNSLDRVERYIFLLAAIVIAIFSYFLYDDSLLFSRDGGSEFPEVGQVAVSNRDVRVKSAANFTWFPARRASSVRMRDSIFTGEGSQAQIRLSAGGEIDLGENSLITLRETDGQISLDLRFGGLKTRLSGQSLRVTTGGETFSIDGNGVLSLSRSSSGEMQISVTEGTANIRSNRGAQRVSPGQSLGISRDGSSRPITMEKIEVLTPNRAKFVKANQKDPIRLAWKPNKTTARYDVELCADPQCGRVIQKASGTQPQAAVTDAMTEGKHYWRVVGFDNQGRRVAASEVRELEVENVGAPILSLNGQPTVVSKTVTVASLQQAPEAPATLQWSSKTQGMQGYEYELSTSPGFETKIHSGTSATGRVDTPSLANGVYYYRVRGVLPDGRRSDWSAPQTLQVNHQAKLGTPPGGIRFSSSSYELNPEELKVRSPAAVPQTRLQWSQAENAAKYELEISATQDFSRARKVNASDPQFLWKDTQPGTYFVRARALSPEGIPGPYSPPARMQVRAGTPVLKPFEKYVKLGRTGEEPPPIEAKARWSPIVAARSYRVQISKEPDFKAPQQLVTRDPASNLKIDEPGQYFVRVQGLDANGNPITDYSEPQPLEYNFHDPMPPPRLLEPYDKAAIFLQKTEAPMFWLEWSRVTEATSYELQISAEENFQTVLFATESQSPRVLLQNRVPVGRFFWRVRSRINAESRASAWSEPRSFEIDSKSVGSFGK